MYWPVAPKHNMKGKGYERDLVCSQQQKTDSQALLAFALGASYTERPKPHKCYKRISTKHPQLTFLLSFEQTTSKKSWNYLYELINTALNIYLCN
jgi:hypothetical protein